MKYLLSFIFSLLPLYIWSADGDTFKAQTTEGVEMTFKVISEKNKTCQVVDGETSIETYGGTVTIPSQANGYSVISIGDRAFSGYSGLTSITIPKSVTSIGEIIFLCCDDLASITVESGNETYDSRDNCNAIVETSTNTLIAGCGNSVIPNSVNSIGSYAFYSCSNLRSVNIPNSVTSIGNYAFSSCTDLWSVTIPNSVTSIGSFAFYSSLNLRSINIPSSVTTIGEGAFSGMEYLTIMVEKSNTKYDSRGSCNAIIETESNILIAGNKNTVIPNSVSSIGSYAFYDCYILKSIDIPNSVTSIGDNAFRNCISLTSIDIPNSVTSIGSWAFNFCTHLTSINIPNSVTSIGDNAFSSCSNLTSIDIPNSVTSIGSSTFFYCTSLTSIDIPNSVTSIGDDAFRNCTSLTSIDIPNSVMSIGSSAFSGCTSLTSIDIPNSVTSIGSSAFSGCTSLTSINIPNSVTSIGYYAFSGCTSLTSIDIPNSVTSIGSYAFQNCSRLTKVRVEKTTPIAIKSSTFSIRANATLYVPKGSKAAYQAADYWKEFKEIVEYEVENITFADAEVKAICVKNWDTNGDGELSKAEALAVIDLGTVFKGNTSIRTFDELQYFTGLTTINAQAFENCTELKDIIIPNSVTSIRPHAFWNCSSLTSITIPSSVTSSSDGAFWGCTNLKTVYIDDLTAWLNITFTIQYSTPFSYGSGVLYLNNDLLTDVSIPESVTSIRSHAFYGCSLNSVTIPNSVTSIASSAFTSLIKMKLYATSPIKVIKEYENHSFLSSCTLYVPKGSKAAYQAADYWKEFKTILEFPDTDVNQDGATDVVDVVDIARYVVGSPSDSFHEFLADLNSDDQVNVADAVVLVNDIAGNTSFAKAWHRMQSSDDAQEQLMLTKNKDNSLSLCMDNNRAYTAFQFDLMMNNDMNVMQMLLNESRKNGHQLLYNKVGDGHYRVVALSTANNSFNGKNGELLNIQLDGFNTDDLTIHNVHFFTGQGNDYAFDDLKLQGGTTAIEELPLVEGGQPAAVYDLQGRKQPTLRRGVNIINGKKVIIK